MVRFDEMGSVPESILDDQIVITLAKADPEEQVITLRKVIYLFDEPDPLQARIAANLPKEVVDILKKKH